MKNYLSDYITAKKQKPLEKELSKLSKPSFGSFDSSNLEESVRNQAQEIIENAVLEIEETLQNGTAKTAETSETSLHLPLPQNCPLCTIELKADDCAELIVRYCPFGCSFVWRGFNDYKAAERLFDELLKDDSYDTKNYNGKHYDRNQALEDALDERTAVLMYEHNLDYQTAMQNAEASLIPCWLDEYRLVKRLCLGLQRQ